MYKFSKSDDPNQILGNSTNTNFIELLKSKWNQIHDETDVFQYKINNLMSKIVDDQYLLQLNPDRGMKRRVPEQIDNVCQPFDPAQFNFNKVDPKEKMFNVYKGDTIINTIMVNISPISRYHSLFCPSVDKNLPQVVTEESLIAVLDMMFYANHRDLRIGFNSLCALASINHLHYHILLESHTLPIEIAKCTHLTGPAFILKDYLIPGFCFQIKNRISVASMARQVMKLLNYFLSKSIAHNIFITRGWDFYCAENRSTDPKEVRQSKILKGDDKEVIRIVVWPRKSSSGVKQFTGFNVAVLELGGWFPIYDKVEYETLTKERLEQEIKKWKYDDFDNLVTEAKDLF